MINWSVILGIAKTHLVTKMKSTVTATLGVTFGIGAYITLVSFMTGLNGMLDDLVLNQTPHIHMYNEIRPSDTQPISRYQDFKGAMNFVHSIKPKQNQEKRIHKTKEHETNKTKKHETNKTKKHEQTKPRNTNKQNQETRN